MCSCPVAFIARTITAPEMVGRRKLLFFFALFFPALFLLVYRPDKLLKCWVFIQFCPLLVILLNSPAVLLIQILFGSTGAYRITVQLLS